MRIAVADDHALFRSGLIGVLAQLAKGVEVAEFPDAHDLIGYLTDSAVDLVIVDLNMDGMDADQGFARLKAAAGAAPVVVLSAEETPATMRALLDAGAAGYFVKSMTVDQLDSALRLVLAGEIFVPRHVLTSPGAEGKVPSGQALPPRQRDILRLIAAGHSNKEIARDLDIALPTVKNHVAAVMRRLSARNRTELAAFAHRLDLLN